MMNRRLAVLSKQLVPIFTEGRAPDFSAAAVEARLGKAEADGLIQCDPISLHLGAVVTKLDLKKELSIEQITAAYDALLKYQVLVFKEINLVHEEQVRFTRELSTASPNLGPPTIGHTIFGHVPGYPEVFEVYQGEKNRPKNMDKYDQNNMVNARPWTGFHCDITACVNPPCIGMLRGDEIPNNAGDTFFGNLVAAYEGLSEPVQNFVQTLKAEHFYNEGASGKGEYAESIQSRKMMTHHPMCVVHPDTGNKVLFNSPVFLKSIVGVKPREGQQIIDMLAEHSVRSEYTMRHKWSKGDLVLWDERCTTHRAPTDVFASGKERRLFRTTLQGKPFLGVDGTTSQIIEGLPMLSAEEEFNSRPTTSVVGRQTLRGTTNSWYK